MKYRNSRKLIVTLALLFGFVTYAPFALSQPNEDHLKRPLTPEVARLVAEVRKLEKTRADSVDPKKLEQVIHYWFGGTDKEAPRDLKAATVDEIARLLHAKDFNNNGFDDHVVIDLLLRFNVGKEGIDKIREYAQKQKRSNGEIGAFIAGEYLKEQKAAAIAAGKQDRARKVEYAEAVRKKLESDPRFDKTDVSVSRFYFLKGLVNTDGTLSEMGLKHALNRLETLEDTYLYEGRVSSWHIESMLRSQVNQAAEGNPAAAERAKRLTENYKQGSGYGLGRGSVEEWLTKDSFVDKVSEATIVKLLENHEMIAAMQHASGRLKKDCENKKYDKELLEKGLIAISELKRDAEAEEEARRWSIDAKYRLAEDFVKMLCSTSEESAKNFKEHYLPLLTSPDFSYKTKLSLFPRDDYYSRRKHDYAALKPIHQEFLKKYGDKLGRSVGLASVLKNDQLSQRHFGLIEFALKREAELKAKGIHSQDLHPLYLLSDVLNSGLSDQKVELVKLIMNMDPKAADTNGFEEGDAIRSIMSAGAISNSQVEGVKILLANYEKSDTFKANYALDRIVKAPADPGLNAHQIEALKVILRKDMSACLTLAGGVRGAMVEAIVNNKYEGADAMVFEPILQGRVAAGACGGFRVAFKSTLDYMNRTWDKNNPQAAKDWERRTNASQQQGDGR